MLTQAALRDLRPDVALCLAGWLSVDQVKDIAASEDSVSAAQRAFYSAALPALPALLLGFLCLEGRHLVRAHCSLADFLAECMSSIFSCAALNRTAAAIALICRWTMSWPCQQSAAFCCRWQPGGWHRCPQC